MMVQSECTSLNLIDWLIWLNFLNPFDKYPNIINTKIIIGNKIDVIVTILFFLLFFFD